MEPWSPTFTWIQADLAVGGSFPIERAQCLVGDHGLGAVIDLRSEACDDDGVLRQCGLHFLHVPTVDACAVSQLGLDQAVAFAEACAAADLRLLVHCEHGVGRSALVALCILVGRGLSPLEALRCAKDAREPISPSKAQYAAWAQWISRRTWLEPPTYHDFGVIAYRHLRQA